jgi:hypothetical protein
MERSFGTAVAPNDRALELMQPVDILGELERCSAAPLGRRTVQVIGLTRARSLGPAGLLPAATFLSRLPKPLKCQRLLQPTGRFRRWSLNSVANLHQ